MARKHIRTVPVVLFPLGATYARWDYPGICVRESASRWVENTAGRASASAIYLRCNFLRLSLCKYNIYFILFIFIYLISYFIGNILSKIF